MSIVKSFFLTCENEITKPKIKTKKAHVPNAGITVATFTSEH